MTTKTKEHDNLFAGIFEDVQANEINSMLQVFCRLINEAMKIEPIRSSKDLAL